MSDDAPKRSSLGVMVPFGTYTLTPIVAIPTKPLPQVDPDEAVAVGGGAYHSPCPSCGLTPDGTPWACGPEQGSEQRL